MHGMYVVLMCIRAQKLYKVPTLHISSSISEEKTQFVNLVLLDQMLIVKFDVVSA